MKKTTNVLTKNFGTVSALLLVACLSGCMNTSDDNLPTMGIGRISIDESLQPVFQSEIYTYESSYPQTHFETAYLPEGDVIQSLLKDSMLETAVICRNLTPAEIKYMESKNRTPTIIKIMDDAIAVVVNKNNSNRELTTAQVKRLLLGQDTVWSQVNDTSSAGKITVVFDNNRSANSRYLSEKLLNGQPFSPNCYAVKSNKAVIEYVSEHPGAIGFVAVNWISDKDDSTCRALRDKVSVVALRGSDSTDFVPPWQTYIGDGSYPFHREVWIVKPGVYSSLGTGFVSFVSTERGQLIILKSGLVPARQPERKIELKVE